jgi:hypothetical protein
MPCLSLAYWIYALLVAGLALCWADVLVRPGMLLAPAQAWLKMRFREATVPSGGFFGAELNNQWWWAPLWGCYKCVAGQWGFWGYLWLFRASPYSLLSHAGFSATTIIFSIILSKWSQE